MEVKHVTKNFGSVNVLKGIDFAIYPGEIFGFVGRNGAGKSTFIHIMTGIMNKSAGDFQIFGHAADQLNQVKHKIGVMPDVANLYEQMKGITFLRYMGELVGDKRNKAGYEQLLKEVGLEGAGNKKIKAYSFGMRKKICIAQALLGETDLIILDEPTSGLDPESAIKIRQLILKLKQQGKTIFLTSHNLDEIDKISDRVGILSEGIIKRIGKPAQLKLKTDAEINLAVRTNPILDAAAIEKISEQTGLDVGFIGVENEFAVVAIPEEATIPAFTKAIIDAEFLLYEVKIKAQSLEDVFMNV